MFRHQGAISREFINKKGSKFNTYLRSFVVNKLTEDGPLVPKFVGGGTYCAVCFMLCFNVF